MQKVLEYFRGFGNMGTSSSKQQTEKIMKAFGMARQDHENCQHGCCAGKYVKLSGEANPGIRARKKTARQQAKKQIAKQEA